MRYDVYCVQGTTSHFTLTCSVGLSSGPLGAGVRLAMNVHWHSLLRCQIEVSTPSVRRMPDSSYQHIATCSEKGLIWREGVFLKR